MIIPDSIPLPPRCAPRRHQSDPSTVPPHSEKKKVSRQKKSFPKKLQLLNAQLPKDSLASAYRQTRNMDSQGPPLIMAVLGTDRQRDKDVFRTPKGIYSVQHP